MKIRKSSAANRDLNGIYDYTLSQWGSEQADRYLASFDTALSRLSEHPQLGSLGAETDGYRRLPHEQHVIFYRILGGEVRVARVLHARMDARRHLP